MATSPYNQVAVVEDNALKPTGPIAYAKPATPTVPKPVVKAVTTPAVGPLVLPSGDQRDVNGLLVNPPGALYDRNTGKPLNVSTTTISNSNKIDQVPNLINNLNTISQKGISTDAEGNARYADGSFYNQPTDTTDTSPEDTATQQLLQSMKDNLDASTKGLIDNIQQKFDQRKVEQTDINNRQTKSVKNALLMGGATGQGSSAQYAPISSEGIVSAQESYGVKQLADLDSQEQDLIAQAKAAQSSGNFQIMEKQLALAEQKRQEKVAAATKLNEQIADQNAKLREQNIQSSRDSSISDLYAQGVTDVASMLNYLNYDAKGNKVGDFTAKEISDTLKNIVPPGLDDLVKTLQNNGAPQDVISKVLTSSNLSDAYKNAGSYAAGGTGVIGEYNRYIADATARGQAPVDFNTYQNMDANRKAKVASAGAPTFTTDENGNVIATGNYDALTIGRYNRAVNAATSILQKNPTFKNIIGSSAYLDRIEAASQNPGSIGDQELLDAFTQLNTGGNRVTEAQVHLITGSGSLADKLNVISNKLNKGGSLSSDQRKEIIDLSQEVYKNYQKSYLPLYKDATAKLKAQGIPEQFWNIPSPDTLSRAVSDSAGDTSNHIIGTEDEAKQSTIGLVASNPALKPQVTNMINQGYTYQDILQILNQ